MWDLIITGALALGASIAVLWLVSIITGTVSFIDAFWGFGFLVVGVAAASQVPALGQTQMLMLILLALWSLRLSVYLLARYLKTGEDKRYVKIIGPRTGLSRHIFTLWFVFGLQGVLILLISAPVFALLAVPPRPLDGMAIAGATLWAIGAWFEWVGDWQLSRFRANPNNAGKVLDTGLWALTRHPNYFGDTCIWWGIWLMGAIPMAIYAPALMTFLLMKWSGVPLLERGLKKNRPDYAAYVARTSAFFPRPPRG